LRRQHPHLLQRHRRAALDGAAPLEVTPMRRLLALPLLLTACFQVPNGAPDCREGEYLTRLSGAWQCKTLPAAQGGLTQEEADTKYFAKTECSAGQLLRFESGAWTCAGDLQGEPGATYAFTD